MVIFVGNDMVTLSSNPGWAICILHSASTVGKGMHPTIFPPLVGQTDFYNIGKTTDIGERKN